MLLYELLTGQTPFDPTLTQRGLDEIRRIIREEEPPRPSTAVSTMAATVRSTVAQHRHTEPPKLVGLLRGDLDWIVMKALEKNRSRRYETANGFADDIKRHLACEPVTAAAPSAVYKLGKFVRRNRTALQVAAVIVSGAIVIAFVMWATTQNFRQTAERVSKNHETLQFGNELVRSVAEMESICLGFLITGEERSLNGYNLAEAEANDRLERLKILTADLPEQRQRVDRLRLDVSRIKEIEAKEIAARRIGGSREAAAQFAESNARDFFQDLHTVTFELQHTERLQLIDRSEKANFAGRAATVVTLAITTTTLLVLVVAGVVFRRPAGQRQRA